MKVKSRVLEESSNLAQTFKIIWKRNNIGKTNNIDGVKIQT